MQDAVQRILEGEFNKDIHSLDFSSPRIELSLNAGEVYEGTFSIYGPANRLTEGIVSSTQLRMICLTESFSGHEEEIAYRFDTAGLLEGDSLQGEFRVVSNQGEYNVPYEIKIVSVNLQSSLGSIKNLFHFTNLAKTNWEEAVKLFYLEDFKKVFKGVDKQHYTVYRGLSGVYGNEQNMEEFLLYIKKKKKVEFIIEESEIRIDNPRGKVENKIAINRNGWGFSELSVEAEGGFLQLEKEIIRDEDFLGNCYRLPFYILDEELHAGKNMGNIRIFNAYADLQIKIIAYNRPYTIKVAGRRRETKHAIVSLMQYYEAFRTRKINAALWMKETGLLIDKLAEIDDKDVTAKLYQIQLLITEERYNEAKWLLDQVKKTINNSFGAALYCYYLYLTTLINRDGAYIDEIAGQVERIYAQNSENWRIAWLLLYLSEDYSKSPSRKWIILEEQFRHGCKSPVFYIEAWNLISTNPTLLTCLEEFEIQVLSYAAKKELLTSGVIEQIVYLNQKQKQYSERIYHLLKVCYKIMPVDDVLMAICTLLIKGNHTDNKYFEWYAKGIEKELRITRLFEYYMMSMKLEENQEIPRMVLMYFAFDSNLDSIRNAFLYCYVYKNRESLPELYLNYREQIERFVVFQVLKGKNNKWLAYLYKSIITPMMITEETANGLAAALFTHCIRINEKSIRNVIVVYEKGSKEIVIPVTGKEVYIPVYGSEYKILLEDSRANRYCSEKEFEIEQLLLPDKLASMIAPFVTDNIEFDLWMCGYSKDKSGVTADNAQRMKRAAECEYLQEPVQKEMRMKLIQFFYDSDRMKELDDYICSLLPGRIANDSFAQVIRIMVLRGMFDQAFEWLKEKGGLGVEPKVIVRLCSRMLALEDIGENKTMLALIYTAFKAGKYDESLLNYLTGYFKGTTKEMRDIWKAAEAFSLDTYHLSERILVQMLYTGAFVGERIDILKRYVSGGAKTEVETAFLAQCAYDYFVHDKVTDYFVIQEIQKAFERQEMLPQVCKLAYTKYFSENKKLIDEIISVYIVNCLRELLRENLYFPYFKEYGENIAFMRQYLDKTMIQYQVQDKGTAVIHYLLEKEDGPEGTYVLEEMRDMFGGICVKQFILFFGERLQYYITENRDGKEMLTESGTVNRSDMNREQKESRYNLINDIVIGKTLNDYKTMEKLLYEYYEQEYMAEQLFKLI